MLKQFLVFAYNGYYPSGGWNDFQDSFDSLEAAAESLTMSDADFANIVDLQTGENKSYARSKGKWA